MAELIGTLKVKFDTNRVSDRFQKREFVLTTEYNTPYPQQIPMQLTQDKCDLLDQFREGDELKVQVNFRGREWNGPQGIKFFLTLECWRVEKIGGSNTQQTNTQTTPSPATGPTFTSNPGDNDDLPF